MEPTAVVAYPQAVPVGSLVLYRLDTKRLVTFDPVKETVDGEGNAPQTFQYPFPGRQDLFTSGSSSDYGFALLQVTDNEIRTVLTIKGRRGLFPLASEGDLTLLVLQDYDAANRPTYQQVVRRVGSSLVPVPRLDHSGIASGALIHGVLSYTVYHKRADRYDLRQLDLRDQASRPKTIRSGLRDEELPTFGGKLVVDYHIPQSRSSVDCDYYCFFSDAAHVVLRVVPDANADLTLSVIDPVSHRRFGSATGDIVGFRIDAGTVDVYGTGLHKRITIPR